MEKDTGIVVNLSLSKYHYDNQSYLCKYVTEDFLDKTFGKLLTYLLNPHEDRLNPSYSEEDKKLAERIKELKENSCYVGIRFIDEKNKIQPPKNCEAIGLEERISGYFGKMAKEKERQNCFGSILYKNIDLVIDFG